MKTLAAVTSLLLLTACTSSWEALPTFAEVKPRIDKHFDCGWGAMSGESPVCTSPDRDGDMRLSFTGDAIISFNVDAPEAYDRNAPFFQEIGRGKVRNITFHMNRADRRAVIDFISGSFGFGKDEVETALNTGRPIVSGGFRIRPAGTMLILERP